MVHLSLPCPIVPAIQLIKDERNVLTKCNGSMPHAIRDKDGFARLQDNFKRCGVFIFRVFILTSGKDNEFLFSIKLGNPGIGMVKVFVQTVLIPFTPNKQMNIFSKFPIRKDL